MNCSKPGHTPNSLNKSDVSKESSNSNMDLNDVRIESGSDDIGFKADVVEYFNAQYEVFQIDEPSDPATKVMFINGTLHIVSECHYRIT